MLPPSALFSSQTMKYFSLGLRVDEFLFLLYKSLSLIQNLAGTREGEIFLQSDNFCRHLFIYNLEKYLGIGRGPN